jgi:hypothetical protein
MESYQISKWLIITKVIPNWNTSQDVIIKSEGEDDDDDDYVHYKNAIFVSSRPVALGNSPAV